MADRLTGAELDAEIDRRIFGVVGRCPRGCLCADIPPYSSDMVSAWLVIEHMRDLWSAYTERQGDKPPMMWDTAPFDDGAFFERLHRHADRRWPWAFLYVTPEAICQAALDAFRSDDDD